MLFSLPDLSIRSSDYFYSVYWFFLFGLVVFLFGPVLKSNLDLKTISFFFFVHCFCLVDEGIMINDIDNTTIVSPTIRVLTNNT